MSFIRSRQVDISLYLPVSLTKSDEYKAGLDAESGEHERMRIALLDIEKQFNVKTVDWGINLWEDLYAINQDRSISNLIKRRDVVIAKMGPPSVVNEPFMDRLVNAYVADKKAEIVSHIDEYRIEILYRGGTILDYDNLRKSIREYLPAIWDTNWLRSLLEIYIFMQPAQFRIIRRLQLTWILVFTLKRKTQ